MPRLLLASGSSLSSETCTLVFSVNTIIIDTDRCKGCYLCIEACPKGCIEIGDCLNAGGCYPVRHGADNNCRGCALCARVCPDAAIEVYKEIEDKAG